MSDVTTLSTKGQLILPKAMRDALQWVPGTRLTVEATPEGVLLKAAPLFPATQAEDVFGCLRYEGLPQTLDAMDAAITAEVQDRHARGRY